MAFATAVACVGIAAAQGGGGMALAACRRLGVAVSSPP